MHTTVLGGALAVPFSRKPPYAGLTARLGLSSSETGKGGDDEGSSLRAAEPREPRQVREEAAVSGKLWVPRRGLA